MADVLLYQGENGGDLVVENGVVALDTTPFTAAFLSLFGGNVDDKGIEATASEQWWGNYLEEEEAPKLRSKTQALLIGLPAIPANLIRIEEAASSDLEWLTESLAKSATVSASIPARNQCRIQIDIEGQDGTPWSFSFDRDWPSTSES